MLDAKLMNLCRGSFWVIARCALLALPCSSLLAQQLDFSQLIENSRQQLTADALPTPGEEKAKLQSAMIALEQYLAPETTENGRKWLEILKWKTLQEQLASERPDGSQLIDCYAAFQQNYLGLEYGPFVQVREMLGRYIDALRYGSNPEGTLKTLNELLTNLGEVLNKPALGADTERNRQIGTALWRLHGSRQAKDLISAIRDAYARPNLNVHVHESLVNKLLGRAVAEPSPVDECLLGTRVLGDACLTGQVSGDLQPNSNGVSLLVHLGADFSSNNIGHNRGVLVRSTGAAFVNASKLIVFNPFGSLSRPTIHSQPTSVSAPLSSHIFSIEHRLRLVRRIASKKAAEMQPAANAIGQGRLERRIARQFDEQIESQLAQANGRLSTLNQQPPELTRLGIPHPSWSVFSTGESVEVSVTESSAYQLSAAQPCPLAKPHSGVVIEAHQSVITNLTDMVLGGRIIRNEDLDDLAQQFLGRVPDELWNEVQSDEPWSITLAQYRPFEVEFDDGFVKVAMRAVDFKKGDRGLNQPTTITAKFLPVRAGNSVYLERQGDVDIQLAQERGLGVVTMRAFMKSKFDKLFPERTKEQQIDTSRIGPKLPPLNVIHLALDEGWLQFGMQ